MSKLEKFNISLDEHHAQLINDAVDSGAYASPSDIVREALADWEASRQEPDVERLRKLWDQGVASGPGQFSDVSGILAEARKRASQS
jgi:antitoxin ParD1/3/4